MEVYIGVPLCMVYGSYHLSKDGLDPSQCPSPKIRGEREAGGYLDVSCTCD